MAKATQYIGGKYLTAEMVQKMTDKERVVTIDHVSEEQISGQKKLVAVFKELEIGLPLNTTRIEALIEIHGGVEETDDWRGTKVRLAYDADVRFQGKRVGGIAIESVEA